MEGRYKEQWKQDRVIQDDFLFYRQDIFKNKFTEKIHRKTVDYIHISLIIFIFRPL